MPSYATDYPCTWNIRGSIITPIKILQTLGIDVFADLRYDTWVLQTIWLRCKNNSWGNMDSAISVASISPLYSFVNHSCEPNVSWKFNNSSTLDLVALKKIGKGEEIFTSYLSHGEMPKAEREVYLRQWLGSGCECARCLREP